MGSLEKTVEDIKRVKVQGAKEIAIYALKFLKNFCRKNGFKLKFEVAARVLEEARPTAVVLHNCLEILKKRKRLRTIDQLIKKLESSTKKIAKVGSKVIKDNSKIMTYCHSSEALAVIAEAKRMNKKFSVIACITEPLEQGVKTAKELTSLKIPVALIMDNAIGFFIKEVDSVIVGCDAIRKEGIINKIGTYLLAISAKENKKPFYVVGSTMKFDRRKKIIIEERPPEEVERKIAQRINRKKIKIRNVAFDSTPWKYVTRVITEKGILKPREVLRLLK